MEALICCIFIGSEKNTNVKVKERHCCTTLNSFYDVRGSHQICSIKLGVLKISQNHRKVSALESLFLIKLQVCSLQLYYKRGTSRVVFL